MITANKKDSLIDILVAIARLRESFEKLHKNIEWEGLEELYPQVSQVFREIEEIEKLIKQAHN